MPPRRARDDTDDFIFDITGRDTYGGAAAEAAPAPRMEVKDPIRGPQGWCGKRCTGAGCFLTSLNTILLIVGAFVLAVGIMTKSNNHFDSICSYCAHGANGIIALGVFVIIVSIAGIIAALSLSAAGRCIGSVYVFVMFVFAVVGLTSMIFVVLLKENKLDDKFRNAWNDAARDKPHDVCDAQDSLKCSGWETPCFNGTVVNGTLNITGCPDDCGDHPEYNNFTESCHDKIHQKVEEWFPWLLIGTIGFFLVTSFSCCLSTKTICDGKKGRRQGYTPINQPLYA